MITLDIRYGGKTFCATGQRGDEIIQSSNGRESRAGPLRPRPYTSLRWSLRSLLPMVLLMVPPRNSLISRLWNALTIMY